VKIEELGKRTAVHAATKPEVVCDHNEMIWSVDHWICARCGYEYGHNNRRRKTEIPL
jgi:hypothetical protein